MLAYRAAGVYNLRCILRRNFAEKRRIAYVIVLVVFGPKKLPEIGKSLGDAIRQFKGAADSKEEKKEEN